MADIIFPSGQDDILALSDLAKIFMFMLEMHGGSIALAHSDIEKISRYDTSRIEAISWTELSGERVIIRIKG